MVHSEIDIKNYRYLLDSISDGIILVRETGEFVYANPQAKSYPITQASWKHSSLYKHLTASGWINQFSSNLEHSLRIEDGWNGLPVKLTRIPGLNGLIGVVVPAKSLSEIASLNQELEGLKKEFQEFTYIISHDLQAPVRAMKSLIDWFKEDYDQLVDDKGKEQLYLLQNRANRLSKMVEGVLEYSRVNRKNTNPSTVDLDILIDGVLSVLSPKSKLSVEKEGQLPPFHINEKKAISLLTAIIDNGLRFANSFLKIKMEETSDAYRIRIKDDGPGIPASRHDHVFKIFQTLSKDDAHIGIGLSIAKRIVEFYKGQIWLDTEPGNGCEVYISFPKDIVTSMNESNSIDNKM